MHLILVRRDRMNGLSHMRFRHAICIKMLCAYLGARILGGLMQVSRQSLLSLSVMIFSSVSAHAFRAPDMSGDDAGAAVVYSFSEAGGTTVQDTSGVGTPLNLNMSVQGNLPTGDGTVIRTNALLGSDYLLINPKPNGAPDDPDLGYQSAQRHRTFLVSPGAATKLNQCTSGITVQVFLRPWFPFQGSDSGNLIVGLSNSDGQSTVAAPNFGLYQSGMVGSESAMVVARDSSGNAVSQASAPGAFYSVREGDNPGKITEIIATQEPSGVLTVYVNRIARSTLTAVTPSFTSGARLVIGNDLVALSQNGDGSVNVDQQRNWSGEIYHMAIYCRGFTRNEILGATLANKSKTDIVRPGPKAQISSTRNQARKLIERLSGVIIPIDHPLISRVQTRIEQNDLLGAAKIVTGDIATAEPGHPDFLNTVIKQFALRLSNREETIRAPLNDMAASFIGVTRDERNAQELLTGDFFYMANPSLATVRSDIFRDVLTSNNHYEDLEKSHWDLGKVLMRIPSAQAPASYPRGQQIAIDVTGTMTPNPDPAGVLTSRAFMSAHAIAGTNRRMVEYTLREFTCTPISEVADTSASPARIGRDVDRLPGADQTKFETSCKGCHTIMDGFRGAFAKFDYANVTVNNTAYGFIRNTQVNRIAAAFGFPANMVDTYGTVRKMNHNENVFPNGYVITDDSFVNNAVGINNKVTFGWDGPNKFGGVGVNQFGRMIADSERFAQCMAKRVFETVCTPDAPHDTKISEVIASLATKFKASGYKFRSLFQDVAAHPSCVENMRR
jgi:hypothetical protein